MSKGAAIAALLVLATLSTLIDSVSFTLSVLSDGIFTGLMIAVVWRFWPDSERGEE